MKTLSDTIVLNNTFDAYEEGVDLLQFRFALAMYAWKRKKVYGGWFLLRKDILKPKFLASGLAALSCSSLCLRGCLQDYGGWGLRQQ